MLEKKTGGITGKGFVKGDRRINRKGRPKTFESLRALAQQIAHEELQSEKGNMTTTEAILRKWALSKDPRLQMEFMAVAYGKVPQSTEISGKDGKDIVVRVIYGDGTDGQAPETA